MVEITQADIVERLRALHVWPQSTADTYPDTLGPRRIKALYEVGEVAHEAADTIERLQATIAALEQPTPELVESVARATYLAYINHPNADWRAVDQHMKEGIWCPQAKAALAAAAKHLKEPTQ